MSKAVDRKRSGKVLLAMGVAGLALGAFLWSQGTALAPVVIAVAVIDLLVAAWMLVRGWRG